MFDRYELTKLATTLGGVAMLACHRGSWADRAGIRYGDIVLAVNDVKTPDWTTFVEAWKADSINMKVELSRDGSIMTIDVPLSAQGPAEIPTLLAEIISEHIVPLKSE